MAKQSVELPVPANDGVGATRDISTMALEKTLSVGNGFAGLLTVEVSGDGLNFVPFTSTRNGLTVQVFAQARSARVRRSQVGTASPPVTVSLSSESVTGYTENIMSVPALNGEGDLLVLAEQGPYMTFIVTGSYNGECYIDAVSGVNSQSILEISEPGVYNVRGWFPAIRVRRQYATSGTPRVVLCSSTDGAGRERGLVIVEETDIPAVLPGKLVADAINGPAFDIIHPIPALPNYAALSIRAVGGIHADGAGSIGGNVGLMSGGGILLVEDEAAKTITIHATGGGAWRTLYDLDIAAFGAANPIANIVNGAFNLGERSWTMRNAQGNPSLGADGLVMVPTGGNYAYDGTRSLCVADVPIRELVPAWNPSSRTRIMIYLKDYLPDATGDQQWYGQIGIDRNAASNQRCGAYARIGRNRASSGASPGGCGILCTDSSNGGDTTNISRVDDIAVDELAIGSPAAQVCLVCDFDLSKAQCGFDFGLMDGANWPTRANVSTKLFIRTPAQTLLSVSGRPFRTPSELTLHLGVYKPFTMGGATAAMKFARLRIDVLE